MGCLNRVVNSAENGGMEFFVAVGNFWVVAIDGQHVLDEVVRSDAEEVNFHCEFVGNGYCGRHLHHDAELDLRFQIEPVYDPLQHFLGGS